MDIFNDFKFDLEQQSCLLQAMAFIINKDLQAEDDKDRRKRKKEDYEKSKAILNEEERSALNKIGNKVPKNLKNLNNRQAALLMLIELWMFTPYSSKNLKIDKKIREESIEKISAVLGIEPEKCEHISKTIKRGVNYQTKKWLKIGGYAVGGAVIGIITGGLAAPAFGGALGSAAGLSGAAAVGHGLALLGGGALAAGGAGMAGGTALVTMVFAGTGILAGGVGGLLTEKGRQTIFAESIKLQTAFSVIVLDEQQDTRRAQEMIRRLKERITELENKIDTLEDKEEIKEAKKIKTILERAMKYDQKVLDQFMGAS